LLRRQPRRFFPARASAKPTAVSFAQGRHYTLGILSKMREISQQKHSSQFARGDPPRKNLSSRHYETPPIHLPEIGHPGLNKFMDCGHVAMIL
jgi:hypothetical protein